MKMSNITTSTAKAEPNWKIEYYKLLLEYILFRIDYDPQWETIFTPALIEIAQKIQNKVGLGEQQ